MAHPTQKLIAGRHSNGAACICLPLLLLCLASSAFAQYRIDQWTASNGLPDNTIRAVLQGRNGYLWLATFEGLVRFDGVRFTVFDKSTSPGIKSNSFTDLMQTQNGDLWAGTADDGVTRYHHGIFTTYTRQKDGRPIGWVRAISRDKAGDLWVLLGDRIVEWRDGAFVVAKTSGFPSIGARDNGLIGWRRGDGFLRSTAGALTLFQRGKVSRWTRRDGLPSLSVQSVAEDERGTLWLATDGGLVKSKDGKLVQAPKPPECSPSPAITFTYSPKMDLVCENRQGTISLFGLNSAEHQILSDLPASWLGLLKFATFYQDREGNLWIGTNGSGLFRVQKQVIKVYSQAQGLRDQDIYPILQDHTGAIWMGGWPGALSCLKDGRIVNYTKRDGLTGHEITSLYEDHEGRLWVGEYDQPGKHKGLRVFQDGRFVFPKGLEGLGGVNAILQDRSGAMWFGTDSGLVRFSHGLRTSYTTKDGLASKNVKVIIEDPGGLWIGGYGGLTRLHNGKFTAYTQRDGLPGNNVDALYEDAGGVLWIGAHDSGLGRLKGGKFTRYTTQDGLFSNGVFQILEDNRGDLWMSSNQGIFRVKKQELNDFAAGKISRITSIAYGAEDGMLNIECNSGQSPAGIKARDGKLWFPTQNGVAVIDPAKASTNPVPPPIVIESCLVGRKPADIRRAVAVKPGSDNIEIQYTALSFIDSADLRFRYKLQGLDRNWVDAGTRRTAYYSHLPPGHYLFRVIAANRDGVWNTQGSTLPIIVLPPYFRTRWFLALIIAVAAGVLVFAWRYRVSQLKRANAAQQAFSRQLMDSQEQERKRIAAGLHDSLGQQLLIMKNWATLALRSLQDGHPVKEPLGEISKVASQAIEEVRAVTYNLRPYQLERLGLTVAIRDLVDHVAASSGIRFSSEVEKIDGAFSQEEEISIYRILQEGLNNIARHSGATEASVVVERKADAVRISMQDNGKGFVQAGSGSLKSGRRGFGLVGMTERVRMLGGQISVESIPGSGSTISISLPLRERSS